MQNDENLPVGKWQELNAAIWGLAKYLLSPVYPFMELLESFLSALGRWARTIGKWLIDGK